MADRPLNRAERRDLQFNKGLQNHGCRNRKSLHTMKTKSGMKEIPKNMFGSKYKKKNRG